MKHLFVLLLFASMLVLPMRAQTSSVHDVVNGYIRSYSLIGYQPRDRMGLDSVRIDEALREVRKIGRAHV